MTPDWHLDWNRERISAEALRYRPSRGGRVVSVADTLAAWRESDAFTAAFSELLAGISFDAFLWETPPVTRDTVHHPFEFTITDCPDLSRRPDPSPFRNQLEAAGSRGIARFPNLSGDATLVVPAPIPQGAEYAHLASFTRTAPAKLQRSLWRAAAEAVEARLGERPLWLSTSGLGVAWLHLRIDDTPKYYAHEPYRRFPYRPDRPPSDHGAGR